MARTHRTKATSLRSAMLHRLKEDPFSLDFFVALRGLESEFRRLPKIGTSRTPRQDAIRFGQRPDLAFSTSTLEELEERGGVPAKLFVRFFGLLGPNGPLPIHLTEYTRERLRNMRDPTLGAFFDVFHHRLVSLFYRAWAVNQMAVDYDRPDKSRFSTYVGSAAGLGIPSVRHRDTIPDNAKLHYAGALASRTRNAVGLEAVLADFFQVAAEVVSLVGCWMTLPGRNRCRLGGPEEGAQLGVSTILGFRVWDVENRFRVRLGPLTLERFQSFLPTEEAFRRLMDWIALYTGNQLRWDLQLLLFAGEVPATVLGGGAQLGWTSWLKSEPFVNNSEHLVIDRSESTRETEEINL